MTDKTPKTGMKIRAVRDGAKLPKNPPSPYDMGFSKQTWAEKVEGLLTKHGTRGRLAKQFVLEEFQEMARRADLYDAEHGNDGEAAFRGSNDR